MDRSVAPAQSKRESQWESAGGEPLRRGAGLGAALVLVVAVAIRLLTYLEIADSAALHTHSWGQSDMHFFHTWARDVAAGDLLSPDGRHPMHTRHRRLACEALALGDSGAPCDEAALRAQWAAWLPRAALWQDPLYPTLVGAVYRVTGLGPEAVQGLQAAAGVATALLVCSIATTLFGGVAGVVAGLLAALFGPLLLFETLLLRASFATALGLFVVWLALRPPRAATLVAIGFCGGALVLLKAATLPFVAALPLWFVASSREGRAGLVACWALGFVVAVCPLVARNVVVGAPPLALAASGPLNFINGNAEDFSTGRGSGVSRHAARILATTDGQALPVVRETLGTHEKLGGWVGTLAAKAAEFLQGPEIGNNTSYAYFLRAAPVVGRVGVEFWALAALALVGLVAARPVWPKAVPLLLLAAAGFAVSVLFFNLSRFRVPVALALAPFAGHALATLLAALRRRHWAGAAGLSAAIVVLALLLRPHGGGAVLEPRIADYGVHNEIALALADRDLARGEPDRALRRLELQLRTQPEELLRLVPDDGASVVSSELSLVADGFRKVHSRLAELYDETGRVDEAAFHRRRTQTLGMVARGSVGPVAE